MDVSQYLEIFIEETKEHLQALNEHILILEKEADNIDTINEIFRAAHSLKGMAGTMGFMRMQRLTHDMENVFSEIRNGNMIVTDNLIDVLFKGIDALESYLSNIQETASEGTEDNDEIIEELNEILKSGTGKDSDDKKLMQEEEPHKEKDESGIKEKYKELVYASHEIHAIEAARQSGMSAYAITVYINEKCMLKSARAFLIFKAAEEHGEIIKSNPDSQDIENEEFDDNFSIVLLTKSKMEDVKKSIGNVSEVTEVYIGDVEIDEQHSDKKPEPAKEAVEAVSDLSTKNKQEEKNQPKKQAAAKPVVNRSVRVDIEKLDILMNLVSELIIAKNGLVSIGAHGSEGRKNDSFNEQIEYLESITTNLHESVMKVRMVPIESVVNRFPRMIRDLAKKLNKKMELYMSGEDTELDRTVIDEIGDPLMHLLRNAADHGIESGEVRVKKGKPEQGTILLDAYQDGNNVVIEVKDDGAGIDVEKVKNKALSKGVITPEQAETMAENEIVDLLFRPSFSTAEVVSDISGRGVGLDVVKSKIEALGGDIEARSVLGEGSNFIIRLPLTLAIIQALMVEIGKEKYAIPLGSIQTIEDVDYNDIKYVQSKEVINLRGSVIPLVRLEEVLDVEPLEEKNDSLTVVIVSKGDKQAGMVVDNLIGQQEIVIKPLGKYINNSKMIGGATILGDGEVALILDVNAMV
ncbi:MAG: chemotaxis protein CheA [Lachnospiraceae bacterium]|nr:chemotaxis protein CheA [Lachnospiraceae bacterium]